jgi:hypothetical protein
MRGLVVFAVDVFVAERHEVLPNSFGDKKDTTSARRRASVEAEDSLIPRTR